MSSRTFAVTVTRHLDFPPERVFDAWLDPEKIRAWSEMALEENGPPADVRRVEVDARVGGRFTFSDMRPEGEAVHWGTYLVIDRPRKLVFTWFTSEEEEQENNSTVTLTFEPAGKGCVVKLVHEMNPKWAEYEKQVQKGWGTMLARIGALLGSRRGPAAIKPVVKAQMLIRRSVSEVFQAFVDPAVTTRFWFTKSSGPLQPDRTVRWEWEMYGVSTEVRVKAVEPNKRILIEWDEPPTTVEWTFTTRPDGSTFVSIVSEGFSGEDEQVVAQAIDSMGGFTLVLAGAKALLEHGIELKLVGDHNPVD